MMCGNDITSYHKENSTKMHPYFSTMLGIFLKCDHWGNCNIYGNALDEYVILIATYIN